MGLREQAQDAAEILRGVDRAADRAVASGEPVRFENPIPTTVETDPSIPADLDVPVHVAWSRVMGEVQFIAKARRTEQGTKYNYRGIDDVMNAVGPAIRKHGVVVIPSKVTPTFTTITTTKGSAMNYCRAVVEFTVIGPRGDVLPVTGEALGEAFDSGDKSGTKASSVAMRTFYTQALAIPTNRPQLDPEYGEQHQIAGPRRPTAAEYAVEILNDGTSLNRLHQIKAELAGDNSLRMAMIEGLDGQQIELGRLLQRVGAARLAKEGGNG